MLRLEAMTDIGVLAELSRASFSSSSSSSSSSSLTASTHTSMETNLKRSELSCLGTETSGEDSRGGVTQI